MFNENIIKWAAILDLVLADDADRFKAILESVYTVSESTTERIKVLGFPIELLLSL